MADRFSDTAVELIDVHSRSLPARLSCAGRIRHGTVSVARIILEPNPGSLIGSAQFLVVVHDDGPMRVSWKPSADSAIRHRRITADTQHIVAANQPEFVGWSGRPQVLAMSAEPAFVRDVVLDAFDGRETELRSAFSIRDPVIKGMAMLWDQLLTARETFSRLYLESLAVALIVHAYQTYGNERPNAASATGGLAAFKLRRVTDYIEAHVTDDIRLQNLAALAGLSIHHFGAAFKASTGTTPYRFLMERRIHKAKERLLGTDHPITEIALSLGFSSHSHFTDIFRKLTNTTPTKFRKDRR